MGRHRLFTETAKWCAPCGSMQPNSEFNKNVVTTARPHGLQDYCRKHQALYRVRNDAKRGSASYLRLIAARHRVRAEVLLAEALDLEAKANTMDGIVTTTRQITVDESLSIEATETITASQDGK